ncbi:hypothetical protein KIPB_014822, partial [Kipferlia bialata]|eukprot:g14822.t1
MFLSLPRAFALSREAFKAGVAGAVKVGDTHSH